MANALTDFFGEMIADIRQKVVDQGWFGREVTAQESTGPHCPPLDPPINPAMDDSRYAWAAWKEAHEMQDACDAQERESGSPSRAPEQGYDIDL